MRHSIDKILINILLLTSSGTALAHPGHDVSSFATGLMHPFSGLDHLLAMVAIGLWAAQGNTKKRSERKIWLLPATFMTMLVIGSVTALQWQSLPLIEAGLATSVLALGLLIALSLQFPAALSITVTGLFGLLHGYAHGLDVPLSASPTACVLGLLAGTVALHGSGITAGIVTRKRYTLLAKAVGVAIAASGAWMLAGM